MTNSTPYNSINPKRLIVVDPSLTDFVGHHAQYDISVIESAEAQGVKGVVLSHRLVSDTIDKQVPIIRTFSEDMWGAVRTHKLGTLELIPVLRGIIACLLLPIFAKGQLAGLKRWISTVYHHQRPKIPRTTRINNSFLKFLIFVILNSAPSGLYSVAYIRRMTSNAGRSIASILTFSLKSLYGVTRFFTPRVIIILAKGIIEKIHIANCFGKLPSSIVFFALANLRYYIDAKKGLSAANLAKGDLVFFHMVIGRNILETAALCEMIHDQTGLAPIVLLRYPPNFLNSVHPVLRTLAIRKLEYLFEANKVRLASDSDRLIDDYSKVTYAPFELLPIPHGAGYEEMTRSPVRKDDRICIASLGNARGEKGFVEIFSLMCRMANSDLKTRVRFIIQANNPDDDAAPYVARLMKEKFPFPVSVITDSLDKVAYEDVVASTDIVLAPYWREIYSSRTSGIALEAIVAGKILITTEDTWMADQVHQWKSGLTVKNRDPADLTKVVTRAVRDFSALLSRSHASRRSAADFHSGKSFIDHILRRKVSREVARKEVCFFYPWGNLFQYDSGASVRSSLLVKKLLSDGWCVEVISDQQKVGPIPKGVRVSHCSDRGASFGNPVYLADYMLRLILMPHMIGLEDLQYRFKLWFRSRSSKMLLNASMRHASAVVLQYEFLAGLIRPFASVYNLKMVVDAHDVLAMQTKRESLRSYILKQEVLALNKADFPCCISDEDRVVFQRNGINPVLIENSIDLDSYWLPDRLNALDLISKAGYSVPSGTFGLFVGSAHPPNFQAVKRLAELSEDQRLCQRGIGFVAAGGCYSPDLLDEHENFIQLGVVPADVLRALYALASVVIIPLESGTGSSIKTMEAFGYGKAVIGTKVAFRGIPVTHGQDCLVVESLDEYPSAIIDLLSNAESLKCVETNAKKVAGHRDFRVTYQPILDAIESI